MNYRVRVDLSFEREAQAKAFMLHLKGLTHKIVSINEGKANEEISFIDYHLCKHDEGGACEPIERIEIR